MTEATDNSSLPLLLSITAAVVAVAAGGWFLLNKEPTTPLSTEVPELTVPQLDTAPAEDTSFDVEAELRKARLAADAEILVLPASQSALHYYRRVLKADPTNAVANAELDAMLAKVTETVRQHLELEEYPEAYEIATLVAKARPEHALVIETSTILDQQTEDLVTQAIQHAQDGRDDDAVEALAAAQALPGRNPRYFDAVRNSIDEIRSVRQAAELDRAQRANLARDEARAAWATSVRSAIQSGNLIAPAGASARDLLAEQNSWDADREVLTNELLAAMAGTAQANIDAGELDVAETMLDGIADLGGNPDGYEQLRATLHMLLVEAESNRVVAVNDLALTKRVSPRYPRRARERDQSGWVDVYFTVTETGETADVVIKNSEPGTVFDKAALSAVEQWAFEPVVYRGEVISQRAAARLVFRLE